MVKKKVEEKNRLAPSKDEDIADIDIWINKVIAETGYMCFVSDTRTKSR